VRREGKKRTLTANKSVIGLTTPPAKSLKCLGPRRYGDQGQGKEENSAERIFKRDSDWAEEGGGFIKIRRGRRLEKRAAGEVGRAEIRNCRRTAK